ncbi:hypothetical protein PV325_002133, partial [Microctonus aethiopoides]
MSDLLPRLVHIHQTACHVQPLSPRRLCDPTKKKNANVSSNRKFPDIQMWFITDKMTPMMMVLILSLVIGSNVDMANGNPESPGPSALLLDGINNVANSATNFCYERRRPTSKGIAASCDRHCNRLRCQCSRKTKKHTDEHSNYDNKLHAASIGLDFKLRRLLDKFRARMPYGFPELDIPILEPLHLNEIYLETHNSEIG